MKTRTVRALVLACLLGAGLAVIPSRTLAVDAPANGYQQLLSDKASAIVSIKYILKSEGGGMMGGGGDQEMEIHGVMIEAGGLVLVSATDLLGFGARFGQPGKPTEMKVLVGEDTQGVEAKFLARDSELDLAWLKIEKAPEKPYAFVDLSASAVPGVGDPLFALHRLGKFYDRAIHVVEGKLGGVTKKPRHLLLGSLGMFGSFGIPVFDKGGKCVGVTSLILPEADEMEGMGGGGMFGGMGDAMTTPMILPAADVLAATSRAKESAATAPAEAPKPAVEAPKAASPETPKTDK
jgi:S1-C subfamily serine protease